MTTFLIIAVLLTLLALAAVLIPLLKNKHDTGGTDSSALSLQVLREQLGELKNENDAGTLAPIQYEKERAEIERRAIEDGRSDTSSAIISHRPVWLAVSVSVAVIALSASLYLHLGMPSVLQTGEATGGPSQSAHAITPQQIQSMVAKLAERLQDNPTDGDGWLMLARSYNALARYPEAAAAYGRASSLLPPDAQLLSDYADTLAMAQGRRLAGDPEKVIARALAVDPRNIKALALSGSAAFERLDFSGAIKEWRKVLEVVPADSNVAERIRTSIADAEMRSGKGSSQSVTAAPVSASIHGVVALDTSLRSQAANSDTVFIFARAASGSRMPLAIKRMTVADLPARFSLDDSMSMPGGAKLSTVKDIVVGARISRSGNATPSPGDLEGYADVAAIGAEDIRVTISKVVSR